MKGGRWVGGIEYHRDQSEDPLFVARLVWIILSPLGA